MHPVLSTLVVGPPPPSMGLEKGIIKHQTDYTIRAFI